ncbi:MAG: hypothetical protein HY291_18540 [Planctomycetes bacterium]|nr:hypothetical protein [Planctomycetota bacterium]
MTGIIFLLVLLAAMVLAPYILGPILIKSNHTQAAEPHFREIDAQTEELPVEAQNLFETRIPELTQLGFTPLACMEMSGYTSKAMAYFTLLGHPENRDMAMLTAFYVKLNEQLRFRTTYVEFVTRFAGDHAVTTNNTGEISVTPKTPGRIKNAFPMIPDTERLYRIHQAVVKREAPGDRKELPSRDGVGRMLTEGIAKEHAHGVAVGYLFFDPAANAFRPTWKGACLMTWKLCWPVKKWIKAARVRKAEALLRELSV